LPQFDEFLLIFAVKHYVFAIKIVREGIFRRFCVRQ
jgi:hypothetical protein